jgi:SAM-dependent MidA family methyltransferase
VERGLAIAVDYGHTRSGRPVGGSLRSYRDGRSVPVLPDGSRDVTAHVAVDSVAAAVGGAVTTQREALALLGVDTSRPPSTFATEDPSAYVERLSVAASAAGFADFYWVVSGRGGVSAKLG